LNPSELVFTASRVENRLAGLNNKEEKSRTSRLKTIKSEESVFQRGYKKALDFHKPRAFTCKVL
jgi:hypothetical protein